MKKLILTLVLILIIPIITIADIQQVPDQTLLSTAVGTIDIVDSFLVSASPGGISVYLYSDSLIQFEFIERTYIDIDTVKSKLFDDTLLILHSIDDKLHLLSVANLPEVTLLGTVDINYSFADFTYLDNDLYVSGYFDGILRYDISDLQQPQFVDSSMKGILVTQLDNDGDYLYALDEYNGLLRYDISGTGFGDFVDYLFVPLRAFAFTSVDSLFYLSIIGGGVLVGDFTQPPGDNIVDSLMDITQVANIYYTDSLLLLLNQREVTVVERADLLNQTVYDISENVPSGEIYVTNNEQQLLLPNITGGITLFDLQYDMASFDGLSYNGMIYDTYIFDKMLYVSNKNEPVTIYSIDTSGETSYSYTIYDELGNSSEMQHNGDTLFTIYPDLEKLVVMINSTNPDSVFIENSITISPSPVNDLYYYGEQIYDNAMLITRHPFQLDIYTVSDSGYVLNAGQWNFIADITSVEIKGTTAYITDRKNECMIYHINQFFEKELINTISLSGEITESIIKGDTLYLFQDDILYLLDISDPQTADIDTVLELQQSVLDAYLVNEYLFTVGYEGISVFDLTGELPELVETGGISGFKISADSNVIAVSDESNLMLYYYHIPAYSNSGDAAEDEGDQPQLLAQNYPNPFNIETSISFRLPEASFVELSVYNMLGQRVKSLFNEPKAAGYHTVSWDGTNEQGQIVSTGIYLYKLTAKDLRETKKMLLIK